MKLFLKKVLVMFVEFLAKSNAWYDGLKEPKRFIIAVIYGMLPFMFLAGFGAAAGSASGYIFGLLWVLIFVVAMRVWWLFGDLKAYLDTSNTDQIVNHIIGD